MPGGGAFFGRANTRTRKRKTTTTRKKTTTTRKRTAAAPRRPRAPRRTASNSNNYTVQDFIAIWKKNGLPVVPGWDYKAYKKGFDNWVRTGSIYGKPRKKRSDAGQKRKKT